VQDLPRAPRDWVHAAPALPGTAESCLFSAGHRKQAKEAESKGTVAWKAAAAFVPAVRISEKTGFLRNKISNSAGKRKHNQF